ncbi:MAG TPA: exosortase/archaeosortase family protein [Bryobacteraceae bacterium]|nr:exosortase/archaeosortase family protein [Bryobacteraceae bacterium]
MPESTVDPIQSVKPTEHAGTTARSKAAYGDWIKIGVVVWLLALNYWQVLAAMAGDWWNDEGASHGLLIPPVALYLAWLRRQSILAEPVQASSKGLWITAFGCLVFLVGRLGAEFFLTRISLVIILTGLIWTFWGMARLKKLSFPLLLLATMVPLPVIVWNALAAPLQLFASDLATTVAQALGVAVYRDGNIIHLAQISLGVAEACSGLHSLSALMIGSLLLGFLLCSSVLLRIVLFALSIPLAIALNVFRIAGTAVLADYWQDAAFGFYHSFSGWLVFVAGFGGLWLLAKGLHRFERHERQSH